MALYNRIICNFGNIYKNNLTKLSNLRLVNLFSDKKEDQAFVVENKIKDILQKSFPSAEQIEVQDVSGGATICVLVKGIGVQFIKPSILFLIDKTRGCGAMFEISVIAGEFRGLSIVKQHRLINEALKEEIKDMHGLRIHTALPS